MGAFVKSTTGKNEALRAQAILLTNRRGGGALVPSLTGLTRSHAINLKQRYCTEGIVCLTDKRKGKPKELLGKKQREAVLKTVKEKTPKDFGYVHNHWTSSLLGDWILQKYKVQYKSRTSLYLIFKKASFTYHRPGTVYKERDETEVAAWRRMATRKLRNLLKDKDAVILAGDEMVLTTATTTQKVWLPVGEYPKIEVATGGRKRRSVYGFLNLRTGTEHAWKTEYQNMHITKEILEKLRALYPRKKIALFWDNAGWHKGSVAQKCVKADGNIEIVWFPRYAPDENPQENVWKAGRSAVTHNEYIADIDHATDALVHFFNETTFPYSFLGKSRIS